MVSNNLVSLSLSQAEVLRLLRAELPPPDRDSDSLVWKLKGSYRFNMVNHYLFRTWTAKLRFAHDRLCEIDIEAARS